MAQLCVQIKQTSCFGGSPYTPEEITVKMIHKMKGRKTLEP